MGYDITFHPISEAQMDAWYFSLLDSLAKGDTSRLEAVAEEAGMDPFVRRKGMSKPPVKLGVDKSYLIEKERTS